MARTNDVWETGVGGTYIQTIGSPNGYDLLINGTNHYLNFNSIVGSSGYGIRDNSGTMQFKNSGGSWTNFGSGGGGSITLEVNGTPAGSQTLLNLVQGTGITITDDGSGNITFTATGGGTGTVTTVSVVTANGISGSVANATTTPAITLTLGAITPTSVNGITLSGSGSLANSGTSSLTGFTGSGSSSGSNTGDQTITLTGHVTGSGTGSFATSSASKFILQGTTDSTVSAAQFLGALGTGILKNTTTTGVLSIAVAADFPTLNQNTTGSAASLTTARTIGIITGDATSAGSSFDGTANNTNALTLATVNSNVGSFGSATKSVTVTVNAKGLVTAISENTVTPAVGSITGLGTGIATFLATPSSANLAAAVTDETGSGALVFGTSPTITLNTASTAVTQSPGDNSTKVATTAYVAAALLGQDFKEAAKYATTTALPSLIYANGSSGVGATLTGVAFGALSIDSNTPSVGDRILVKNQVSTFQNGIYVVTTVGGVATLFVLTRSTDFNQSFEIDTGDTVFVSAGTTLATTTWAYNGIDQPTMGTDAITFAQTAGQGSFTAGNGISITGVSIAIDTSVTVDKTTSQALTNKTYNGVTLSGSGSLANSGTSSLTGFTGSGTSSGTNTGDQNLFSSIPVSGQTTVTANATTTALTFIAGTGMTITTDNVGKSVTFTATGGGTGTVTTVSITSANGVSGTVANATTTPSITLSVTATTKAVAQTSHGFTVGQVLKFTGGAYALAKADSAADAEVVGAVYSVVDANNFVLITGGYLPGLTGLTANTTYFLDPSTAGALTSTAPSTVGQVVLPLLVADSTTTGFFQKYRGELLTAAVTTPYGVATGGTGVATFTAGILISSGGTAALSTVAAPSGIIVGTSDTQNLTNKRITRRTVTTTQSATPAINTDNTDVSNITGLAQAITSFTTNLTGTPGNGDLLEIRITDNGTARAITWGASFVATTVALPTTTVISTMLRVGFEWNSTTSKWECIAVA